MVKISVVIVNYRVKYFLEQSLRSVRAALKTYPMEVEIFVVDNHSQDDSLDYLIPRFPEVRFIANTENVGFARANNQAIEQSTGKYVLLLNPDTVIAENTLFEVFQFMEAHPEAGGTGVKMLDGDGRFLPESIGLWFAGCGREYTIFLSLSYRFFQAYETERRRLGKQRLTRLGRI